MLKGERQDLLEGNTFTDVLIFFIYNPIHISYENASLFVRQKSLTNNIKSDYFSFSINGRNFLSYSSFPKLTTIRLRLHRVKPV